MRHRLSGEYTSVGNLKMDWGQGRRKGVLGVLIERLFFIASVQAGRNKKKALNRHYCVSGYHSTFLQFADLNEVFPVF